jgi:selenocysteine-specific translation elongation factor
MDGIFVGVFGTDKEAKAAFESAVAKKSEAEGIAVFTRSEGGRRYSLLDTPDYPERIQGYSSIVSLADYALYFYPKSGRLSPADGELAVLLGTTGLPGTLEIMDGATTPTMATTSLKGTAVGEYRVEERQSQSGAIDLSVVSPRKDFPAKGTLIYIDRVFTVKGVGTVALGFVVSGRVSVHDQLRPIPGPPELRADVKGIQVNDVNFDSAGRGVRVGLSIRGVEPKEIERSQWFDDGSFAISDTPSFEVVKTPFYKPELGSRDLHIQLPGEMVPARLEGQGQAAMTAKLPWQVPVWEGMKAAIIDLNGGNLRVAGGATLRF